ncbi:ABC transporter permease [Streptomyces sp. NPDC059578]|uniref:ABC transporter permease n=1 Tax=unclassified Streptomyces TaxID=2593676 RepID=UPI00365D26E9
MPDTPPSALRTQERPPPTVPPRRERRTLARRAGSAARPVLLPVTVAVAIGAIFISVYLSAFHAPVARDLPVAVVGTAATAQQIADRLPDPPSDTFRVEPVADRQAARDAVEHGEVFAAYAPGPGGAELLHAGAHGPAVTTLVTTGLGQLAQEDGQRLEVTDVVPASPQDTRGLAVFYTTFGLVLAGYLFGIMTYQLAPGVSVRRRLAGLAAFGIVGGLAVAFVVSAFGALPAPFAGVAALVALVATAVGAATMLLVRALGVWGSSAAAVVFMTVGNATSGGSLPAEFLPSWLAPFSEVLPVGVGVRAVNGLAYFHGDGVLVGALVLAVWTTAGVGGLVLLERVGLRLPLPGVPRPS